MSGVRCPKCGNTDASTIWEDNFWSGCDKCGWAASCENNIVLVPCPHHKRNDDDPLPNYDELCPRSDE